ncbi:hypothetical protein JAAARDRAFT_30110 [Jaapia argillacea MUCL 33604]|uniref:Uncharacterized protein n=1 Tax=Jaapia argillacea MUCL 33604 TaxID=933084 RepID=A0A067QFC4_9AGAM|nr:hypothetical protein JAAARDRAFT_30110 [Jaapia argillacea MUCL 33604]
MVFFSSRKAEPSQDFSPPDHSVVRVIRSRFYGKQRGKGREGSAQPSASTSSLPHSEKPRHTASTPNIGPIRTSQSAPSSPLSRAAPKPSTTDVITVTLAQRLNELAAANAEGLLNDDEYRLLRQNLFERLASGASVPVEAPIVRLRANGSHPQDRSPSHTRPTSNFIVSTSSRPPSIQSKHSVSSTVTSILRRATGRRVPSSGTITSNDTTSIFSQTSKSSNIFQRRTFPRLLSRKGSDASFATDSSVMQNDAQSITSHRTRPVLPPTYDPDTSSPPAISRSTHRSLRRLAGETPPSSFPGGPVQPDAGRSLLASSEDAVDDGNLDTTRSIRHEIELVEAEGKRLLDAFNGLELTALTRRQQLPPIPFYGGRLFEGHGGEGVESNWTLVPDRKSTHAGKDSDGASIQSAGSMRTTLSAAKSTKSRAFPGASHSATLARKASFSSSSSRGLGKAVPPPSISSSVLGRLGNASGSVVNLTRSTGHLPLAPVDEGSGTAFHSQLPEYLQDLGGTSKTISEGEDCHFQSLEHEMEEIKRRRAEVTARYEARLEYLKAKLKGAELREKVLKR